MAINPYVNIGNCPVCGNVITSYHCIPCTSMYVFGPCECRSQTWTVIEGKFVGKSSQDIPPTTDNTIAKIKEAITKSDNRMLAEVESMLRGISQRCGPAATPEWMKAEIDRVANLLRTWQR